MRTLEERLRVYGFRPSDVQLKNLVVQQGQTTKLNKDLQGFTSKELTPTWPGLKQIVGISDEMVQNHPHLGTMRSLRPAIPHHLLDFVVPATPGGGKIPPSLPKKFTMQQIKDARTVAVKYVFGDSSKLGYAEPFLNKSHPHIRYWTMFFDTIEVYPSATLEIDRLVSFVFAKKIKIHTGGKVLVHLGNIFKLDVDVIEKI